MIDKENHFAHENALDVCKKKFKPKWKLPECGNLKINCPLNNSSKRRKTENTLFTLVSLRKIYRANYDMSN